MKIHMISATGTGPTQLAAFYDAINNAGVANYNLIPLSSVIPPATEIVHCDSYPAPATLTYGDVLFVVMSQQRETTAGKAAWAGLGWSHDKVGGGWFVELHDESEEKVRQDIFSTLNAMTQDTTRGFQPVQHKIVGIECTGQPVCSVVIAVFGSRGWSSNED
ncbi:pyruvoyl-dependent arginine decarboxylase [Beggiatoa leptomitoformis]|uniref:Pyruvoyl-dependent arginine decarboxylase AaxB n=1 Tax=Beggiatoa leptomitoformis TaxID=288004 RepID=A0A2N9YD56_9GAMM|nr:pyruvoyl-dependent arginine decarboxylase [Beggiatoa leptomitoformis]ALG69156.1 hypothetical protein AL038_17515 [Beggiatoa leptomitoformis]AUI68423.1 hypothetical protein BLE401_06705 [Beggiatoa leptomitoformis]